MTEQSANRLVCGLVLLVLVVLLPGVATHVAVRGLQAPAWFAVGTWAALAGCALLFARSTVRGSSATAPCRVLLAVGVTALVVRTVLVLDHAVPAPHTPWLVYVVPLLLGITCVALPRARAAVPAVVALSSSFGLLRTLPGWGGLPTSAVVEDAAYGVVLGVVCWIAYRTLHQAAVRLTAARAEAAAARQRAEVAAAGAREQARWDALVHDDVLSALSTAVTASDPVGAHRAAGEARRALQRIAAEPPAGDGQELGPRLRDVVREADAGAQVRVEIADDHVELPPEVLDALVAAAAEAVRNVVQHAGPGRSAQVSAVVSRTGARVVVTDTGHGFDPLEVPGRRLGLRVSVRARMAAVGGSASWRSRPGAGTTVEAWWPR